MQNRNQNKNDGNKIQDKSNKNARQQQDG